MDSNISYQHPVLAKQQKRQRLDGAYIFILQWHSNYNSHQ